MIFTFKFFAKLFLTGVICTAIMTFLASEFEDESDEFERIVFRFLTVLFTVSIICVLAGVFGMIWAV